MERKRIGVLVSVGLVAVLAPQRLGATDPANGSGTPLQAGRDASNSSHVQVGGLDNDDISRMTLTWHELQQMESCVDRFGRQCSSTFPTPQCPTGITPGADCTAYGNGYTCYQTIPPGNYYNFFKCE